MAGISKSYNGFAFNLYKEIADKDSNLFYSPYSIAVALSMCTAGAKNNTEKQLKEVLKYAHLSNDDVHNGNSLLQQHLNSLGNSVSINVANKIYQNRNFQIKSDYLDLLRKFYNGDAVGLNFSNASESAKTINDWVEVQTKNKIKNLVPELVINELTKLILVNAIYFKGNWDIQFNKNITMPQIFFLSNKTEKNVDMMGITGKRFNFIDQPLGVNASVCRLPYAGNQLSMTVILPHENINISNVESQLNANILQDILSFQNEIKVNVFLPKFKFEQQFELSTVVSKLGAPDAFSESKADFSGIQESTHNSTTLNNVIPNTVSPASIANGLYISNVIHKAVVEVNEEGTEAAAATAVVMRTRCAVIEHVQEFRCNRPFLFIIHENKHQTVLFIGRYSNPQ